MDTGMTYSSSSVMSGVAEKLDILLQYDWTLDCIRYTHSHTNTYTHT